MDDRVLAEHMKEDAAFQKEMREWSLSVATKDDIGETVVAAIEGYFKTKGKTAYAGLLIAAGIVGALVVIGGGLKSLLAWIGFAYLK